MIQPQGLNHLTLRVSQLGEAIDFFGRLGCRVRHRGRTDAYLECGSLWLALLERSVGDASVEVAGLDHFALTVTEAELQLVAERMKSCVARGPATRGVGQSLYLKGPDGIIVELHTSNLEERLKVWR